MNKQYLSVLIIVVALFGLSAGSAAGQNLVGQTSRGVVGIKAGIIGRMHLKGDLNRTTQIGSSLQMYADWPVTGKLFFCGGFDFYFIKVLRQSEVMLDASLGAKYAVRWCRSDVTFKPGVMLGAAHLGDLGFMNATRYLTIKVFVEATSRINVRKSLVGEIGLFRAPTGGNSEFDVNLGSTLLVRLGVTFR